MKKSELVSGKHVVVCRNGKRYLVAGEILVGTKGQMFLPDYSQDLSHSNRAWDIVEVLQVEFIDGFSASINGKAKRVWQRPTLILEAVTCNLRSDAILLLERLASRGGAMYASKNKIGGHELTPILEESLIEVGFGNVFVLWDDSDMNFYIAAEFIPEEVIR